MKQLFATVAALLVLLMGGLTASANGYQLDNVSNSSPNPGEGFSFHANGFGPNTEASATLFSTPVLLGTFTADAQGVVRGEVTIPANTPVGPHRLEIRGVDRDGNVKVVNFNLQVGGVGGGGGGPVPGLPATGGEIGSTLAVSAIVVGFGLSLFAAARRRAAA